MKKALRRLPTISKLSIGIALIFILPFITISELTQTSQGIEYDSYLNKIDNDPIDPLLFEGIFITPDVLANWKIICYLIVVSWFLLIYARKLFVYLVFDRYYRITKRTVSSSTGTKITYKIQTAITLKGRDTKINESKMLWRRYKKYGRSFNYKEDAKKYFDLLTRQKKIVDTPISDIKKRRRKFTLHRKMPSQFKNGPALIIPFFPKMFIGSKMVSIPTWIIILLITAGLIPFIVPDFYLDETKIAWMSTGAFLVLLSLFMGVYMSKYNYYLRIIKREIKQGANSKTVTLLQASRLEKKNTELNKLNWKDLKLWYYSGYSFSSPSYTRNGIRKRILEDSKELLEVFNKETNVVKKVTEETVITSTENINVTVESLMKSTKTKKDIERLEELAHQYSLEGESDLQEIYEKAYNKVFYSKMFCQFVPEFKLIAKNEKAIAQYGYEVFPYSDYKKMRRKIGGSKNDWEIIEGSDIETHGLKGATMKKPAYWNSYLKFIEIKQQTISFEEKVLLMNELEIKDKSFRKLTQALTIGNVQISIGTKLVIGGQQINTEAQNSSVGEQWIIELLKSYGIGMELYNLGYNRPEKIVEADIESLGKQLQFSPLDIDQLNNNIQRMKEDLNIG